MECKWCVKCEMIKKRSLKACIAFKENLINWQHFDLDQVYRCTFTRGRVSKHVIVGYCKEVKTKSNRVEPSRTESTYLGKCFSNKMIYI